LRAAAAAVAHLGLCCRLDFGLLCSVQLGVAAAVVAGHSQRCDLDFDNLSVPPQALASLQFIDRWGGVMDGAPPLHLQL
jgi:hypothetical protein